MVIGPGARGRAVRDIQQRLIALGHSVGEDEGSRAFGSGTAQAVSSFQQARGLLVDGLVGPDTWRELVEASWRLGDRTLYLRSPQIRGDDVRELQERLSALGFDAGRVDGILGPRTALALREFQENYGLPPDAIVGESTVRALAGLPHLAHPTVPQVGPIRERESFRRLAGTPGLVVVIDPGHGGPDRGDVGPDGLAEADCVYAVARHLEERLAVSGASVFLTRDDMANPTDRERAHLANRLSADIFLSIHTAAHTDSAASGSATFYYGHERFESQVGARLADLCQSAVCGLGLTDGRTHAKTWPILRETRMPAVHLEPAYLTSPADEALLADDRFRRMLAGALAEAVGRFASSAVPA